MKIFITGGNGFVGKNLVPELKSHGHECILFSGDIRNKEDLAKHKNEKIDAVIHLAAKINGRDKGLINEVNIDGTKNILEICREIKPKIFIFLSSQRVLSAYQTPYSVSKKEAEEAIVKSGIPHIILRPGLLYGQNDKNNLSLFFSLIKKLPLLPIWDFKIQPLFVGDLVKIMLSCLTLKPNQIINIIGQEEIGLSDFLSQAKSELKKRCHILRLPKFFIPFLKLISRLPFFPFPFWQIQPLLNDEIFSGNDWPRIFKIKPTTLKEGLKHTVL